MKTKLLKSLRKEAEKNYRVCLIGRDQVQLEKLETTSYYDSRTIYFWNKVKIEIQDPDPITACQRLRRELILDRIDQIRFENRKRIY